MVKYSILLALALMPFANASTLTFGTGGGRGHTFLTSGGQRVNDASSLVKVGYLSEAGNTSTFVEFGRTTLSDPSPTIDIGGFLTTPVANNDGAANRAAQGKQIYLWVFNSGTEAGATEQGLFTSTDPSWVIPGTFTGGATESSAIVIGKSAAPGLAGVTAVIGSYAIGPVTVSNGTNAEGSNYTLAAIPEAGSSSLLLAGCLAMLARRKR